MSRRKRRKKKKRNPGWFRKGQDARRSTYRFTQSDCRIGWWVANILHPELHDWLRLRLYVFYSRKRNGMLRKKSNAAVPPEPSVPETATPETVPIPPGNAEPPPETSGNGEGRKPVQVFGHLVARDSFVQASIWERQVTLPDGVQFTCHDVSVRERYKDAGGQWQSAYCFRGSELYAVLHALQQASSWILEARASAASCPF